MEKLGGTRHWRFMGAKAASMQHDWINFSMQQVPLGFVWVRGGCSWPSAIDEDQFEHLYVLW